MTANEYTSNINNFCETSTEPWENEEILERKAQCRLHRKLSNA